MKDSRIEKLANNLLTYSVNIQKGDNILIEILGEDGIPLAKELIKRAEELGAKPFFNIINYEILRVMLQNAKEEQIKMYGKHDEARMKDMQAYIGIRATPNSSELNGILKEVMELYNKYYTVPVHFEERVKHTKWCILRYPNNSMAQMSKMNKDEFEDFYFNACNLDYSKMSKAMDSLKDLLNKTDKVHIIGEGTDLRFSVKGIPAEKYTGTFNIPDGEVASAPVKNSVNGYIGEFAFGLNPYIEKPIGDTLFDEKIKGSFHFTPGDSLEESDNGNRSSIHWDIVNIQTPEYGGGEIYFDDVLIRKDGRFVLQELECLNPENLI